MAVHIVLRLYGTWCIFLLTGCRVLQELLCLNGSSQKENILLDLRLYARDAAQLSYCSSEHWVFNIALWQVLIKAKINKYISTVAKVNINYISRFYGTLANTLLSENI